MSRGAFWLTVVSVNWGRTYRNPSVFKRNVLNVLEFTGGREHVVILPQELDEEPDPANEHREFGSMLEPGTRKVYWPTREPIILSPAFKVIARRRIKIMGSGLEIDRELRGVGPARHLSMCVAEFEGIRLAFGNTHPHRQLLHPKVDRARAAGAQIMSDSLTDLRRFRGGVSGVYGTDYNSRLMPRMVPGERVAHHQDLDHLRYWQHPKGARIERKAHGSLEGTIDPHDPIWARFRVSAR